MAYKNLQAPTTNPKAAQRLADTQAIQARAAVGKAPAGTSINEAAQQTGAALTAGAGQQALQQQQQQAGIAKGQAQNVMQQQKLGQQQTLFDRGQDVSRAGRKLDQQLFNISEGAANQESNMRRSFNDRVAQNNHLQQLDLANWAITNSQNEQQFKDRIQSIEQAHAKKSSMINHAYKMVMEQKRQESVKASGERRQQLQLELKEIRDNWAKEQARQKAEAQNRQSMIGAGSMILGAGVAAAAVYFTGGAAAPYAPAIMGATSAAVQGSGTTESGLEATGAI